VFLSTASSLAKLASDVTSFGMVNFFPEGRCIFRADQQKSSFPYAGENLDHSKTTKIAKTFILGSS